MSIENASHTQELSTPHLIRVGDLARLTGKTVRAIHLYEEQGLLHPATRSSGGFRLYEEHAVERVRWIDLLHGLGFSLHEMRDLLTSWWKAGLGPDAMDQLRSLFQRKLAETREAIVRHQQLENELNEGLRYLEACRVCKQDHGMGREPALVAGIVSANEGVRRTARPGFVRVEEIE